MATCTGRVHNLRSPSAALRDQHDILRSLQRKISTRDFDFTSEAKEMRALLIKAFLRNDILTFGAVISIVMTITHKLYHLGNTSFLSTMFHLDYPASEKVIVLLQSPRAHNNNLAVYWLIEYLNLEQQTMNDNLGLDYTPPLEKIQCFKREAYRMLNVSEPFLATPKKASVVALLQHTLLNTNLRSLAMPASAETELSSSVESNANSNGKASTPLLRLAKKHIRQHRSRPIEEPTRRVRNRENP